VLGDENVRRQMTSVHGTIELIGGHARTIEERQRQWLAGKKRSRAYIHGGELRGAGERWW
jgi:predicted proteasome-type protease